MGNHPEVTRTRAQAKVLRYLHDIHERERALLPEIQAQLAAAPPGGYRDELSEHLAETRTHIRALADRLSELGYRNGSVLTGVVSLLQSGVAHASARRLTPLDLLRPSDPSDRVLQRARHAAAAHAANIADYRALDRIAESAGDPITQSLAARLGAQEQQRFDAIIAEIPALTDALGDTP
jgi:ferritin-like metal-binding protein YciE